MVCSVSELEPAAPRGPGSIVDVTVRCEKALDFSGCDSRPGGQGEAKKKVKSALERMALIARQVLIKKRGKKAFNSHVLLKRQWQVNSGKGFGRRAKKTAFRRWYDKSVRSNNCVYVFWSGRKCVYVRRTLGGKGRPSSSFDKFWFSSVTRIDVYSVASPSVVSTVECLAIDLFDPSQNVYSSSKPKFSKKCPICSTEKKIKAELRRVFPLRRTRP